MPQGEARSTRLLVMFSNGMSLARGDKVKGNTSRGAWGLERISHVDFSRDLGMMHVFSHFSKIQKNITGGSLNIQLVCKLKGFDRLVKKVRGM